MPEGFERSAEAQFHKAARLLHPSKCDQLRDWWFAIYRGGRQTAPSFDIACTCTVRTQSATSPGLLLVEAKAHVTELLKENGGKRPKAKPTVGELTNHKRIGTVISAANQSFINATGLNWSLSRDSYYQMSNRFVWAWKLTELGYPVILVYLGFLEANEMADEGKPFASLAQWESLVKSNSEPLVPPSVWNREWKLNGQAFLPLIRAVEFPI